MTASTPQDSPATSHAPALTQFPEPRAEDWLALVQASLKGASAERLRSTTADGLTIEPLYRADTSAPASTVRPAPAPDADRPWDLRSIVAHPDPVCAADQALEALGGGAASLLLRIDPQGRAGVVVHDLDSLAKALSGVVLDAAPVALDAGFLGPQAADWLAVLAKGAPEARLAFHLDPISAFAVSGVSPGPLAAHINAAAQTAARHAGAYPKATFFLASGQAVHEAGGSDGQELGVMAAAALAYAKAGVDAGLPLERAFDGIVLGLAADQAYLEGVAKFRAARAIWSRLAGECRVAAPASIEARSSARMLSKLDPWTNLLRLTAAGFAAGVGGADAVALDAFTAPLGAPTTFARRQARNIQLVLMREAHLGRVADPAGGAWCLETLTDALARKGWEFFQAIEAQGGLADALQAGFVAEAVATARATRPDSVIVGASKFLDKDAAPVAVDAIQRSTAEVHVECRWAGEDSHCPPLNPIRFAEPYEEAARA